MHRNAKLSFVDGWLSNITPPIRVPVPSPDFILDDSSSMDLASQEDLSRQQDPVSVADSLAQVDQTEESEESTSSSIISTSEDWKQNIKYLGKIVCRVRFYSGADVLKNMRATDLRALRTCIIDNILVLGSFTELPLSVDGLLADGTTVLTVSDIIENVNGTKCPRELQNAIEALAGAVTQLNVSLGSVTLESMSAEEKSGIQQTIGQHIKILREVIKLINNVFNGRVRIEDDVLITANGVEYFAIVPRTVDEIE